jgi:hypothetical protein
MLARAGITRQADGWYHLGRIIAPPTDEFPLDYPGAYWAVMDMVIAETTQVRAQLVADGYRFGEWMFADWGVIMYYYNRLRDEYQIIVRCDPDDIAEEFRPCGYTITTMDWRK